MGETNFSGHPSHTHLSPRSSKPRFSALPPPQPDRIGAYEVGRPLGGGSSGRVFASTDLRSGDQVAVKLMQSARVSSPFTALSFARELRALSELAHRGIPELVDSGLTIEGNLYVVMTRVRGNPLSLVLRRARTLGVAARRTLVDQVLLPAFLDLCDAIEHAHGRGFVHRDLKPANIIIDVSGRGWVVDWGLATDHTTLDSEAALLDEIRKQRIAKNRSDGPLVTGTPGYMSPERFGSDCDPTDPRLDVFGMGAVLFDILTGKRAFGRKGGLSGVWEAMAQPAEDPRDLDPTIGDELAEACNRALARELDQRTPSISALRRAVADAMETTPSALAGVS